MNVIHIWMARIRAMFHQNRNHRLAEEIQQHAELLASDYMRRGMTAAGARSAALRDLGNLTSLQEEYRDQGGLPLLENFFYDLKFATRTLRRNLTFTASSTATLAVGLGSMIAILCVVSAFLWKPLPYPDPERLVVLKEVDPRSGFWSFSEPDLLDLEERSTSLAAIGAYRRGSSALTGAGEPETIQTAAVTPSLFGMFEIKPGVGRAFQDARKYVVISRRLWRRKWRMNPAAVGQAIALDGERYTIAGVAGLPVDLLPGVDLLVPLLPNAAESRTAHEIEAVARLRPGIGKRQAQAQLNIVAASIAHQNPRSNQGWGIRIVSLRDYVNGPVTARMVWMIFAAVALLWVLACANVAGLQMARSIARGHEMSTRSALGASSRRLFVQTLTENLVLACFGSVLGVFVAENAVEALRRFGAASLPRLARVEIDATTIGIALACMLLSTLLFTIFSNRSPGFQGGRKIARRDRGRDALIVVQVALASVLLLSASLLLHSFVRLRAVDPGFDPQRVLSVSVNLPVSVYDSFRRVAFFRDAIERLAPLPEVESAGATNVALFSGHGTANRFRLAGESVAAGFRSAAWRAVTPGFFTALGVPLKRGRLFTDRDANGSLEVVILSESMAKEFWPDRDPIGQRLLWGGSGNPKTIVGIVGDLRDLTVAAPPVPTMFRPFAQLSDAPMTLLIRTKRDPAMAIAAVRRAIWSLDPNAALEFQPLRQAMADSILRPRAGFIAVAAFALIALLIAAFGLYGLISYRVNQRQQEIGIRLALGCPARAVRWSVEKRCLLLVCAGLAIGLPMACAFSTLMTSLLYETQPMQASMYAIVLFVFLAVALAASYGPANRASRMDPASAIRHE
jgi:putative ABC transport system permease protein